MCIELCQCRFGLVESAKQQKPACRDQPGLQRVGMVSVRLQRGQGRRQRAWRAAEIAHGQRHLSLGDDTARAGQLFVGAEATGGAPKKFTGTRMLAELGHGNAAQGQCRRVVAQGDAFESAERIASGEGPRGSGDQGIHAERIQRRVGVVPRL